MNWPELNSMGLKLTNNRLLVLDQTQLPHKEIWMEIQKPEEMFEAIQSLKVRGAPLIGVAAALSLAKYAESSFGDFEALKKTSLMLRQARPTAVNLMNALDPMNELIQSKASFSALMDCAVGLFQEDVRLCQAIGDEGADSFHNGDGVLTHCNAGALATVGIGTAVGVIRRAWEQGKRIHVYVDETRPLYQGARLTAWELSKLKIPFTLICDNMAASLMAQGKVQRIVVGADRIATNGDFANKIGTYSLAVHAKHHGVPFYVAAPETTVDLNAKSARDIPIEERAPSEVYAPHSLAFPVWNPAFDITPQELVTDYFGCRRLLNLSNRPTV